MLKIKGDNNKGLILNNNWAMVYRNTFRSEDDIKWRGWKWITIWKLEIGKLAFSTLTRLIENNEEFFSTLIPF